MLWKRKDCADYSSDLLEVSERLSSSGTLGELAGALGASALVRNLCDGIAIWYLAGGAKTVAVSPGTDRTVSELDVARLFPDQSPPQPVEIADNTLGHHGCALLCPLARDAGLIGAIGFFRNAPEPFRGSERNLASTLAAQLAAAIENIELRKAVARQIAEIRSQKDYIEKIVDSINSGILVIDHDGRVLTANPSAAASLKTSVEQVVGADVGGVLPRLREHAANGLREAAFELKDGSTVHLGFSISPLELVDGRTGSIVLFRDLSEIMELRAQMRRKEYFAVVGETASWIAHEVKTPLFAISAIAKLLLNGISDPELKKMAASILTETDRLDKLVGDVLSYGKPLELRLQDTPVADLLFETREQLAASLSQAGCTLEVETEPDLVFRVDRNKLKQVFHNLVANAREAGSRRITAEAGRRGDRIQIVFRDDGRGVKVESLPKVFRPFYTTKKAGTGLGLPICKKIVEEHGGTISIQSRPEQGAEVALTLRAEG